MKIHFLSNRTSKWAEKYQSQRYKIELENFTIKPINFIFLLQPLSFSNFGSAGFFSGQFALRFTILLRALLPQHNCGGCKIRWICGKRDFCGRIEGKIQRET